MSPLDTIRKWQREDKAKTLQQMSCLVGRTIKEVYYDNVNDIGQQIEGVYGFILDDGTQVSFSSSGDDMTHTSMDITKT